MSEGQPDFMSVEVTVKVTPEQRAAYAAEYHMDGGVADDMTGRLRQTVETALYQAQDSHWLRKFTTYSVSNPR